MRVLVYILSSLEGSKNANTVDGLSHGWYVTNWQFCDEFFLAIKNSERPKGRFTCLTQIMCAIAPPTVTKLSSALSAAPLRNTLFSARTSASASLDKQGLPSGPERSRGAFKHPVHVENSTFLSGPLLRGSWAQIKIYIEVSEDFTFFSGEKKS